MMLAAAAISQQRLLALCEIGRQLCNGRPNLKRDELLRKARDHNFADRPAYSHRVARILDKLAFLLVAHDGSDCVAIALRHLTRDKVSLLAATTDDGGHDDR